MSSTWSHNMVNVGPLAAGKDPVVWSTPANFNGFRLLVSSSQTLRRWTEGATYVRQGDHHVGQPLAHILVIIISHLVDHGRRCNRAVWHVSAYSPYETEPLASGDNKRRILQTRCPSCRPTHTVKALTGTWSTEVHRVSNIVHNNSRCVTDTTWRRSFRYSDRVGGVGKLRRMIVRILTTEQRFTTFSSIVSKFQTPRQSDSYLAA